MNSELFFDKKRYISTKESSKISGYSSDYIGQLCRSGKLDCKRISNTWFIFSDSLDDYIKENGKPSKALKAIERKKVLKTQTPVKQESLNAIKEEIVARVESESLVSNDASVSKQDSVVDLVTKKNNEVVGVAKNNKKLNLPRKILSATFIIYLIFTLFANRDFIFNSPKVFAQSYKNINIKSRPQTSGIGPTLGQ
jgi:hypothetical protein